MAGLLAWGAACLLDSRGQSGELKTAQEVVFRLWDVALLGRSEKCPVKYLLSV